MREDPTAQVLGELALDVAREVTAIAERGGFASLEEVLALLEAR